MPAPPRPIDAVIFDLGGVLVDWNPRHLLHQLSDPEDVERFLKEVSFYGWLKELDAGKPFAAGVEELSSRFPHRADLIAAYWRRWPETIRGDIPGTVAILMALKQAGMPLYALSNWAAETWPHALASFDFLRSFDGLVVSGLEGVAKPDREIFALACDRYGLTPSRTVFIDDHPANVTAAGAFGLRALQFSNPATLREELKQQGLELPASAD